MNKVLDNTPKLHLDDASAGALALDWFLAVVRATLPLFCEASHSCLVVIVVVVLSTFRRLICECWSIIVD